MGRQRPGQGSGQVNHRANRGIEGPHQVRITWQEAAEAWRRLLDAGRARATQLEAPTGTAKGDPNIEPEPPVTLEPQPHSNTEKEIQS
jgi:hypothetical protein